MLQSDKLKKAVKIAGGRQAVADKFNLTVRAVDGWYKYGIPPKYVQALCDMIGGAYKPHQLRPDFFEKQ